MHFKTRDGAGSLGLSVTKKRVRGNKGNDGKECWRFVQALKYLTREQ
jgi:hypothetical protein